MIHLGTVDPNIMYARNIVELQEYLTDEHHHLCETLKKMDEAELTLQKEEEAARMAECAAKICTCLGRQGEYMLLGACVVGGIVGLCCFSYYYQNPRRRDEGYNDIIGLVAVSVFAGGAAGGIIDNMQDNDSKDALNRKRMDRLQAKINTIARKIEGPGKETLSFDDLSQLKITHIYFTRKMAQLNPSLVRHTLDIQLVKIEGKI